MAQATAFKYERTVPEILTVFASAHQSIANSAIEPTILHLVQLRASQINRCGYCVEMHTREARADGETDERLDRVIVWDQVDIFTDREKAALAWTESLTRLDPKEDRADLRNALLTQFTEREIGALTAAVALINLWNRINISKH